MAARLRQPVERVMAAAKPWLPGDTSAAAAAAACWVPLGTGAAATVRLPEAGAVLVAPMAAAATPPQHQQQQRQQHQHGLAEDAGTPEPGSEAATASLGEAAVAASDVEQVQQRKGKGRKREQKRKHKSAGQVQPAASVVQPPAAAAQPALATLDLQYDMSPSMRLRHAEDAAYRRQVCSGSGLLMLSLWLYVLLAGSPAASP